MRNSLKYYLLQQSNGVINESCISKYPLHIVVPRAEKESLLPTTLVNLDTRAKDFKKKYFIIDNNCIVETLKLCDSDNFYINADMTSTFQGFRLVAELVTYPKKVMYFGGSFSGKYFQNFFKKELATSYRLLGIRAIFTEEADLFPIFYENSIL